MSIGISEYGIKQCTDSQKIVNELDIHSVLVSPLRRTLMTAYYVYKDHPNFENIKFVLVPSVRESLNITSDIPTHVDEVVKEFQELLPNLDDSEINKRKDRAHWFLDDLKFQHKDEERQHKVNFEF